MRRCLFAKRSRPRAANLTCVDGAGAGRRLAALVSGARLGGPGQALIVAAVSVTSARTKTSTVAAPALRSPRLAAFSVAPVVITSSISSTRRPPILGRQRTGTAKARLTFSMPWADARPICGSVLRVRISVSGTWGFPVKLDSSADSRADWLKRRRISLRRCRGIGNRRLRQARGRPRSTSGRTACDRRGDHGT